MNGQTKAVWWAIGLLGGIVMFLLGMGFDHQNEPAHQGAAEAIKANRENVATLRNELRASEGRIREDIADLRREIRGQ